jgi:predicted site-specific integrase-resolvase
MRTFVLHFFYEVKSVRQTTRHQLSHGLRWFRSGTIQGYQAPSGTIIVIEQERANAAQKVAIDARVSAARAQSECRAAGGAALTVL